MDPTPKAVAKAAVSIAVPETTRSPAASRHPERRPSGVLGFKLRTSGVTPALRLGVTALWVGFRWLFGGLRDSFASQAVRARRRAERERWVGERIAGQLGALKGAFAKAGQFASLRVDVLPAGLRAPLASLRDRVPALPLDQLEAFISAELGVPLDQLFAELDPTPLGAASIAQVHRGRLPDGREVAVKIQYPWLRASTRRDLAVLRGVLALAGVLRGGGRVDRRRLFDEFATTLGEELDFRREARVAGEIAANLADDPQIVVPEVVASHSADRVLTVLYHDAIPISDVDALRALSIRPAQVLEPLARAYAKQAFVDGLFHADPHPGNLFVLREETATPRVLFVDFGLSKRLGPTLRGEVRRGIYALLQGDPDGVLAGMERMGMIADGARPAVAASVHTMFERLRGEGAPTALAGDQVLALKDEAKRLLDQTPGLQLPNELLLYARTLSYLFALGQELDPEVDLMKLSLPYVLRFLASTD